MAMAQSRRSFVKTAGTTLLVAGLTGMGLAGCSSKGGASESAPAADGDFAWDEETDVLVVGAGLAGVAAAVTVGKESPDASCLLIEKGTSPLGNGNSPFSSGWFMYTSADREQAALDYLKELRHSDTGTPDDVLAAFATELTRNLDWIKELGAADTDLTIVPGTTDYACFPEYPELEHSAAIDYAAFTAEDSKWDHVTKFMNEVVGGLPSVTLKTECPLVALVQDPTTKAVLGGIYNDGKNDVRVKANKGVIMTCVLTAFLGNITEPLEFSFLFISPQLFAVYCVLCGLMTIPYQFLHISIGYIRGTIFDFGIFGLMYENTHWLNLILLGIVNFVIFYFVFKFFIRKWNLETPGRESFEIEESASTLLKEKNWPEIARIVVENLGGPENIVHVENCVSRLRIDLKDPEQVNQTGLRDSGCAGIFFPSKNHIHVVFGPHVEFVRNAVDKLLKG